MTAKNIAPFTMSVDIPGQQVADVLDGSLETNDIRYWAISVKVYREPAAKEMTIGETVASGYGYTVITEDVDSAVTHRLDREKVIRGLQIMREKYPRHYQNAISENGADAETGDVLIQCSLFREIVYS